MRGNQTLEMAGAPWHVFGISQCPRCGADVPVALLLRADHRCAPGDLEAREAEERRARDAVLHAEIAEHLGSSVGQKRLAFAGWCREHGR